MAKNRVGIPTQQINNHYTVFICGVDTLSLPAPEFDNIDRYESTRVNRRTRGGDLYVFRDPHWPKTKVLVMSWNHLNADVRLKVIRFLKDNLGKQVIMYAHTNAVYTGVIRTPEGEFTETVSGQHTVKIEFETE